MRTATFQSPHTPLLSHSLLLKVRHSERSESPHLLLLLSLQLQLQSLSFLPLLLGNPRLQPWAS